jgi:hypothetical protein
VTAGRAMFANMFRQEVGEAVVDLMGCAKIEGCLVAFPAFELARTTQRGCSIHSKKQKLRREKQFTSCYRHYFKNVPISDCGDVGFTSDAES